MLTLLKYRLQTVFGYILVAVVLMGILHLIAEFDAPFSLVVLFATFIGFFLAAFRMSKLYVVIHRLSFFPNLVAQLVVFQILIILASISIDLLTQNIDLDLTDRPGRFEILHERNVKLYYKSQLYAFTLIFFFELQSILGRDFFWNYLSGKYNRPREEKRLFMFLDLADSTRLAEKLGAKQFYNLLNDCYALLSVPSIRTRANIVKYIGDEAIISWSTKKGFNRNNCISFKKLYQEAIDLRAPYFMEKYGEVPHFRAAAHMGWVVAAYLGDEKKQLDYSGDTMNTTSRILDSCVKYEADFLISKAVYDQLELPVEGAEAIGEVALKGKSNPVAVYKIG